MPSVLRFHVFRRFGLPLVALLGALLAPTSTLAGPSPPAHAVDAGHRLLGPAPQAIAAISPTDVWEVGTLDPTKHRPISQTYTAHWDGISWTKIPSPSPGAVSNSLSQVEALSANDVWALGRSQDIAEGKGHQLLLHWDGVSWTRSPLRGFDGHAFLSDVSAVSPSDAWAVGAVGNPRSSVPLEPAGHSASLPGRHVLTGYVRFRTLTEHWNGSRWRVIPSPNIDNQNILLAVAAISTDDVWAVGYSRDPSKPLAEHWNGSRWKIMPLASPDRDGGFATDIYAAASDDVWVIGYSYQAPNNQLLEHWDGTEWTAVDSPLYRRDTEFLDISGTSGSNIWAVGYEPHRKGLDPLLIQHWDGTTWSNASIFDQPDADEGSLRSVTTDQPDDAWAIGFEYAPDPGGGFRRVAVRIHWDGTKWSSQ